MIDNKKDVSVQALQILKEKLSDWRDGTEPAWNSTWSVFERLITRHDEMKIVYAELQEKNVSGQRLWVLLEQCIFAGAFATESNHAALRADYRDLQILSEEISGAAIRLEMMLRRRSEILNRSGNFSIDRLVRLTDYIDEAGQENGLYRNYIQPRLDELNDFDLKYWPNIADLLQVLGRESTEVHCQDDATRAIVDARRASLTDFFKEFFSRLHDISDGSLYGLPRGFRLSNSSIATLCNVICDRQPEQIIDEGYIKRLRQRLREQGVTTVW